MLGKAKCKILKEIRQTIADENDIPYVTSECTYQGDCSGTCPKCERELAYLEKELEKRQKLGKSVAVTALCAGVSLGTTACVDVGGDDLAGYPMDSPPYVSETEELAGAPEIIEEYDLQDNGYNSEDGSNSDWDDMAIPPSYEGDFDDMLIPPSYQGDEGGEYEFNPDEGYNSSMPVELDEYGNPIMSPDYYDVPDYNDVYAKAPYDFEAYREVWCNFNSEEVKNGPAKKTTFRIKDGMTLNIKSITTFHYNNGDGDTPGTISLYKDGELVGTWQAAGRSGDDTLWDVIIDQEFTGGSYEVVDSSPDTWSCNKDSDNAGFAEVRGEIVG